MFLILISDLDLKTFKFNFLCILVKDLILFNCKLIKVLS